MSVVKKSLSMVLLAGICGCVTTTTENGRQIPNRGSDFRTRLAKLTAPAKYVVKAVTPKDTLDPVPWDWGTGIPTSVAKSETIPAVVPVDAVVAFAPDFKHNPVRLASTDQPSPLSIQVVNTTKVRNYADLHASVEAALSQKKDKLPVMELGSSAPGSTSQPVEISYDSLVALEHASLPDHSLTRIVEDGNPWVIIKDNSVRCKLMVRREQRTRLVHVAVAIKNCWGPPVKLPANLRASCDQRELRCLKVAEILSRLYEGPAKENGKIESFESFMQLAERDDYLIPVNYKQLEAKLAADTRLASIRPTPAFATVGGIAYPGPPVLGDARALSAFMLQPKVYAADEAEQVGWVVFEDRQASSGNIRIAIDLGSGPRNVDFIVPQ